MVKVINSVPTVASLSLAPTAPVRTGTVTATFAGSDPDVTDGLDTLSYTYKWRIGTHFLTQEKSPTLDLSKYPFAKAGDVVSLELRATDGTSLSQAKTASVTIASPVGTAANSPSKGSASKNSAGNS